MNPSDEQSINEEFIDGELSEEELNIIAAGLLGNPVSNAKKTVGGFLDNAQNTIGDLVDNTQKTIGDLVDDTQSTVDQEPEEPDNTPEYPDT